MTKQTPMEYAKEFSFSGIAHLLGFGVAASALAVAGAPNAALAALAISGISLLGHGAATGSKALYEFLSNDGKKLNISDEANDNIKYFIQTGIYSIFSGLAMFAGLAVVGASLPVAGGIAAITGVSFLGMSALARFAPVMWNGFCNLVGLKADQEPSNESSPKATTAAALKKVVTSKVTQTAASSANNQQVTAPVLSQS